MINARQNVGDIANRQPSTIEVFERLGIQYCCQGDEPLDETCRYLGLPVDGVLSELNRAANLSGRTKAPWADPILESLIGNLLWRAGERLEKVYGDQLASTIRL